MTESPHKSTAGLRRIVRAMSYTADGLRAAYRHEFAFRQELALAVILLIAAVALPFTLLQTVLLLIVIAIVLIVELLNSAIEATVDRISLEDHELAKRAKDVASAAVFLSLMLCATVWVIVIIDRFF